MMKKTIVTNIVIAMASLALFIFATKPIFLTGDPSSVISKWDKEAAAMEEAQFAKQFFTLLQAHELDAAKALVDPTVVSSPGFNNSFVGMMSLFPNEKPKSVKFIGWRKHERNFILLDTGISLEYEFSNKWLLATASVKKRGNDFVVLTSNVKSNTAALENLTKFEFAGQGIKHYAVFTAAILLLLFNIYVLALCIKDLALRPISFVPWLWTLFVLLGFGVVDFNWVNGMFSLLALIKFPVAGFALSPYDPLVITLTVPLGAILFLLKRRISQRRLVPA